MALVTSFNEFSSAVNAPAVITLPATFGVTHKLGSLQAKYDSGGVGDVFVTINAVEVYRSNVAEFNAASWPAGGLFGNPNETLVVTIDAGGPFITGSITALGIED